MCVLVPKRNAVHDLGQARVRHRNRHHTAEAGRDPHHTAAKKLADFRSGGGELGFPVGVPGNQLPNVLLTGGGQSG